MPSSVRPVFRVSVVAILLFQVAALFARSMLEIELQRRGMDAEVAGDLSYLVVPPILLVLMFPYLQRCRDSLAALFARKSLTVRVVVASVALGLTLRLTYWATLTVLVGTGVIHNDDPSAIVGPIVGFDCPPPPLLLLSIAVVALLVPVVEEVGNRGFILHALFPTGQLLAVLVSSATFAVMHPVDTYFAAFCVGLLLSRQVINFGALWGPILAHATYNATTVIDWECLRLIWNPEPADPTISFLAWLSAPVALVGVMLAMFLTSKKVPGIQDVPRASRPTGRSRPSR